MKQRSLKADGGNETSPRSAVDFGRLIRLRRVAAGLTQADLAMQAGVSVPTVSAIENGKDSARIGLVLTLCADLGIRFRVEN